MISNLDRQHFQVVLPTVMGSMRIVILERERNVAVWLKTNASGKQYLTGSLGNPKLGSKRKITLWVSDGWEVVKKDEDEDAGEDWG
jgi:uncharacterized protein (DUF736 family)